MEIPQHLQDIQKQVQGGSKPMTSPRTLLAWFGAFRRGPEVVSRISRVLTQLGLKTEPDFEGVFIDDPTMTFIPLPKVKKPPKDKPPTKESPKQTKEPKDRPKAQPQNESVDPTFKISRLKAANRQPISVRSDDSVGKAITKMMNHDFSQLPILNPKKEVEGMISWRSIGQHLALGQKGESVMDFCEEHQVIYNDQAIFKAIEMTIAHDCVLVRNRKDEAICGIITNADLGAKLSELSQPFLLIGEIENSLRHLLNRFGLKELRKAVYKDERRRKELQDAAGLTFGETVHFVKRNWNRLGIKGIDQQTFVDMLFKMKNIRNDVMHFDPDGLSPENAQALNNMARFFQNLRTLKVLDF